MVPGTGNIFADLGYSDAADRQIKTHLAIEINALIQARKLKRAAAAQVLGIPQPKVSALANYRLEGFSVERMMGLLTALNQDVEIMIRPRTDQKTGHVVVSTLR